jgi:hypothetical protein
MSAGMSKIVSSADRPWMKQMRTRFQSALTGLLFGGFWGGIAGAIVFGVLTSVEDTGAEWNWISLFMIFGLIWGMFVGCILGAIIGSMHADRRMGIIIGAAVGLLITVRLLFDGIDIFLFVVIPVCAILGWIISSTLQPQEHLR